MDVLIAEDEAPKLKHLVAFVSEEWPKWNIRQARSVRTAIGKIRERIPDLLLLDMSLPTFDIGPDEPGGRPQGFGGIEVMRYLDLEHLDTPIIVVTAYEAFSQAGESRTIDHDALDKQLRSDHFSNYRGLVYYNSLFADWRTSLSKLIQVQIGSDL